MAKFAIFSKGSDINNLYRIARNEETKNYYFSRFFVYNCFFN
jgi:hypothetical protein